MMNQSFEKRRTFLSSVFAEAGANLLQYMHTSDSALAAIPDTRPQQYVVAGTVQAIIAVLPKDEQSNTAGAARQGGITSDEWPTPADILAENLDNIAEYWTECMYDAPGGSIDIGASLRAEFAKLDITAHAAPSAAAGEPVAYLIHDKREHTRFHGFANWKPCSIEEYELRKEHTDIFEFQPLYAHPAAPVQPTMPALPEPWITNMSAPQPESREHYARDQMEEYGAACFAAGRAAVQPVAVPAGLRDIGHLIAAQNNRYTDQPMFIVQQKRTYIGAEGYNESDEGSTRIEWRTTDDCTLATPDEEHTLECAYQETFDEPEGWKRYAVFDVWEFVTACFTEQGCKDYLSINGHNLNQPRVYAEGSYRNKEFRTIRNWLCSLAAPSPAAVDGAKEEQETMAQRGSALRQEGK